VFKDLLFFVLYASVVSASTSFRRHL